MARHEMRVLVTRDENGVGTVWAASLKPSRRSLSGRGCWVTGDALEDLVLINWPCRDWFPEITWASEPVEMTLTLGEVEGGQGKCGKGADLLKGSGTP